MTEEYNEMTDENEIVEATPEENGEVSEAEESRSIKITYDDDGEGEKKAKKKKPPLIVRILKFFIPWKGDSVGSVLRKIVFDGALAVFIITAVPLLTDILAMYGDQRNLESAQSLYSMTDEIEIPETVINEEGEKVYIPLPSFKDLLEVNPDTVGYIRIDDTGVNGPVVKGKDNDFYLTHDFYGNVNKSGNFMLDYRNEVIPDKASANYIIFGHNMAVGTFFGSLGEYWRTMHDRWPDEPTMSYYKNHPTITFNTIYEKAEWKIFAIDLFNVEERYGEVYDYINRLNFKSREDFNNFIIDIMDRSDIFTDVDLKYGDQILTLSTCYWPYRENMKNVRLAVFARKVREDEHEDKSVNVDVAKLNPLPVRWEWVYQNVGGDDKHKGLWDRRKLLSYTEEDAKKDGYVFPTD